MQETNSPDSTPNADPRELELGQCILVDLDFLLDTRLGTISRLGEELIEPLMKKGYWKRQHDFFNRLVPKIDMDKYKELYAKRDWETLAHSRLCNSIFWLNGLTRQMERRMYDTPFTFPVVLYLNIYPYALTDQEIHVLGSAIRNQLAVTTTIKVISKSNKEITPEWVKEHVALLAKYDGDAWITEQSLAITKCPLPTITLVMPALLNDPLAVTPITKGLDGKDYNLFEELPKGMAVLIDMTYIAPEEVSVVNPLLANTIHKHHKKMHEKPPEADNKGTE